MGWLSRYNAWVYELDDGVRYPADARGFPFSHTLKIGFRAHCVSVNMGAFFLGVSRRSTKLTDNHPLLPKVEDYMALCIRSPIRLHGVVRRDELPFLFSVCGSRELLTKIPIVFL